MCIPNICICIPICEQGPNVQFWYLKYINICICHTKEYILLSVLTGGQRNNFQLNWKPIHIGG